ncbi:glycosyltransferase family 2 protein [Psychrobacter sp. CAL346-MNA-CIBAN-0220]|uniref:glycosyltransferase family 2 protein n=1 Tax=Psychrobacter sp. CAL346-MNA-CIBAN-0220 TaxID=3140457 RepID=UPI003330A3C7
MTIGREVYAEKSLLSSSSPAINNQALRQHISSNDDGLIGLSGTSLLKINVSENSVLKDSKDQNDHFREDVNNNISHRAFNTNDNSITFYQSVTVDNDSDSIKKTIKIKNAVLENASSSMATPVRLSFQLMTHAEPAEMVIATIKSLLAIKATDDEILIVDNNHTEIALYEPLAKFCAELNERLNVHFYHIDAVAGFKAGALNLALGLMDPRCTYVVVVDSDYQALPQARRSIAAAIANYPNHALLQFPQFYRDADRVDVHSELNHYFNHHLYRPFNRQRALSTGTYAVIRRTALLRLGGWSGASITEDAQMGVLMHRHGLCSQFIPQVIATGILPNTLSDLMSQRRRWIYGNMQVLNSYFSIRPLSSQLAVAINDDAINTDVTNNNEVSKLTTPLNKIPLNLLQSDGIGERLAYMRAHLSQLSAWINLTGIFILLHVCILLIITGALLTDASINLSTLIMPLYVVYTGYALFLIRRLWAYWHDREPLNQQVNSNYTPSVNKRLRAWALHLNFWELGALSWLPVLWGRDKPFICTPKQEDSRTRRTVWAANIVALPKLLLMLNIITAVVVSPLSPLYSPALFICAITVCLLKLWAAKVIFANYAYTEPKVYTIAAQSITPINTTQNSAFIITKTSDITKFEDKKTVNS